MTIRYDPKGKYFTDLVAKIPLSVKIITSSHHIEGTIYLHSGNRLLDELNQAPNYLAVTDARIDDGSVIDFIAINVDLTTAIYPIEEPPGDLANDR